MNKRNSFAAFIFYSLILFSFIIKKRKINYYIKNIVIGHIFIILNNIYLFFFILKKIIDLKNSYKVKIKWIYFKLLKPKKNYKCCKTVWPSG